MANKLTKNVSSNINTKRKHNTSFSEITKSPQSISLNKLQDIYSQLFGLIPKRGKKSHESLIIQSRDYLRNYIDPNDSIINNLIEESSDLENELFELQQPDIKEHPVYPNNSLLKLGSNGQVAEGHNNQLWVMQNGAKRNVRLNMQSTLIRIISSTQTLPSGTNPSTSIFYINAIELNNIDEGPEIAQGTDLSINEFDVGVGIQIFTKNPFITSKFYCEGKEVIDSLNQGSTGYFYSNFGCKIKLIKDVFSDDDINFEIEEIFIPFRGETTQTYLREVPLGFNYDIESYTQPSEAASEYISLIGKDSDNPTIVDARNRIFKKEIYPNAEGELTIINGIPDENIVFGEEPTYDSISNYSTRILYNHPQQYGSLGQEQNLQNKFVDKDYKYYQTSVNLRPGGWPIPFADYKIYGQPILRYDNDYIIFLRSVYWVTSTQYYYYRLSDGNVDSIKESKWIDKMGTNGYILSGDGVSYNNPTNQDEFWSTGRGAEQINMSRVKYIGLYEKSFLNLNYINNYIP